MTTLPSQMRLKGSLAKDYAQGNAAQKQLLAYLDAGETVTFGPSPTLSTGAEWSLFFLFEPGWRPWTDPRGIDASPCVLSLGPQSDPGGVLQVRIPNELDRLILCSSKTDDDGVAIKGDLSHGVVVLLSFAAGTVTVSLMRIDHEVKESKFAFQPGDTGKGPALLTLGTDSAEPMQAPFIGVISAVAVFDEVMPLHVLDKSAALNALFRKQELGGFAGLGRSTERPVSGALACVALAGSGRLAVIPRDILWPDADDPPRFVLEYSDTQPIQLDVPGIEHKDHSIFTST